MAEWIERWTLTPNTAKVFKAFRSYGCQIYVTEVTDTITWFWVVRPTPRKKKKTSDNNTEQLNQVSDSKKL